MLRDIGFLGLGTVGRHMAANLLKGNYNLTVYDSDPEVLGELVRLGAKEAASPREAASGQDVVIQIRPEKERLLPDIYGPDGVFAGIGPGTILIDMGTHSLDSTMEMADEAVKRRVMFLDAPVWGTKEHAANGLLTILAGGDPSVIGRCRELFSFFGLNVIHIGNIGDATKMKFIVNLVQAELMVALAEGWCWARNSDSAPTRYSKSWIPAASHRHFSTPKVVVLPAEISPATSRSSTFSSSCSW